MKALIFARIGSTRDSYRGEPPIMDEIGGIAMASENNVISRDEIRQTLMKLFEAETGEAIESLTDDQNMAESLGLDSVDMVSLIMQLERHFKIRLSHEELAGAAEVGLLLDIVQQKVNEPKSEGECQKIAA